MSLFFSVALLAASAAGRVCDLDTGPPLVPLPRLNTAVKGGHMPQWMTFYGCDPVTQKGVANLCISDNSTLLVASRAVGMSGMAQVTWCFFQNAEPPRKGLQLRADYAAGWADCKARKYEALWSNSTLMGTFLGDELLGQGVTVDELATAAETVKAGWPTAIVYWNEMWDPIVNNDTYAHRDSALHRVPDAIDWVSVDFYRTTTDAWSVPQSQYAAKIYPKMSAKQFALQVPQAFGKRNWVHPNVTEEAWWDSWSAAVAEHYFSWAQADPRIIGINPWYWGKDRPDVSCGGYNVSVLHQPTARAAWTEIGQTILKHDQSADGRPPVFVL